MIIINTPTVVCPLPACKRRWIEAHLSPEVRARLHFFNTFFYKKLSEKSETIPPEQRAKANHNRVRKWTKVC
jgi:Ulp1 family protease